MANCIPATSNHRTNRPQSWTDRIIHSDGVSLQYDSILPEHDWSDHLPVFQMFKLQKRARAMDYRPPMRQPKVAQGGWREQLQNQPNPANWRRFRRPSSYHRKYRKPAEWRWLRRHRQKQLNRADSRWRMKPSSFSEKWSPNGVSDHYAPWDSPYWR